MTIHTDSLWVEIARHINASEGENQVIHSLTQVDGGDISQAYHLQLSHKSYFVKLNTQRHLAMFDAEAHALKCMHRYAPSPICTGVVAERAFIAMEHLDLIHQDDESGLGELVAQLHQEHSPSGKFGWDGPNYIGLTLQINDWNSDWATFWWQSRLQPQLSFARQNGFLLSAYEAPLQSAVKRVLGAHTPAPALLHGDLWSGNKGYLIDGRAVIFDPAAYYGDAEADIAMTELFGGFSENFYRAYYAIHPTLPGYEKRRDIYNLYHILNHLNLFGRGYLQQTKRILERICAQS